jgi:FecR protein
MIKKIATLFLVCALILFPLLSAEAADRVESIDISGGSADVTFVQGPVMLATKGILIKKGDTLSAGDRVETGENARLELKFPDGSLLRFDENTTFDLKSAVVEQKEQKRDIGIGMLFGKTWAKVARFFKGKGHFAIYTKTAVCGVRGTVYRLNVHADNSVMARVYEGEIVVDSFRQPEASGRAEGVKQPAPVSGPKPVPGPHPVSMEEWTYIVKSLQQIDINPDGTASKPFRFDIREDLNDWVLWNQQRDKLAGD